MTTKANKTEQAEQILKRHGCELTPAAFGGVAISVSPRESKGWLLDQPCVEAAIKECQRVGIDTSRWLR